MKLRDRMDNELRAGDTIAWQLQGEVLAHVEDVTPPGTERLPDGSYKPGKIMLQVEIPIPHDEKNAKDINLRGLLKTFDPKSERLAEQAMAAAGERGAH